jgi:hypothetical protein
MKLKVSIAHKYRTRITKYESKRKSVVNRICASRQRDADGEIMGHAKWLAGTSKYLAANA